MDELNEILIKASKDPMYRPEFYRMLLDSNIYFLTNDASDPGVYKTDKDTSFSMLLMKKSNGEMICPIFTSVERIQEAYPNSTYGFVGINARVFFNNFSGTPFILNPGCEVSKELLMSEVQSLLDGALSNDNVVSVPKGTKINIRQPMESPVELIEILKNCFSQYPEISEAYFAEGYFSQEEIHPIVAVRGRGDLMKIFSVADRMIADKSVNNQAIDFINLAQATVLEEHFKDKKPFYIAENRVH